MPARFHSPPHRDRQVRGELFRFAVTGGLATAVHVLCYLLLYPALLNSAAIANILAFSLATSVSYVGNARWVFPQSQHSRAQIARFCLSALSGLGLNTLIAWRVVDVLGASRYLSVALMISVTPLTVFLINKYFVFSRHGEELPPPSQGRGSRQP